MPESVFERAERAGTFVAVRERALVDDPDVLAIRNTAAAVADSTRMSWIERQLDAELRELVFDTDDRDARAVERLSRAAAADDSYRAQLVDLAALHGGLYLDAVNALYELEVRSLGRWEAEVRHQLDRRQLQLARERDAEA